MSLIMYDIKKQFLLQGADQYSGQVVSQMEHSP